jgi:hypothetical protein
LYNRFLIAFLKTYKIFGAFLALNTYNSINLLKNCTKMERKQKPGQLKKPDEVEKAEDKVRQFYGPDKVKEGYELALLGLTDKELAKTWGLSPDTIAKWKIDHPEFREAVRKGRTVADGRVAASLYRRAVGFWVIENKVNATGGKVHVTPVKKYIPPDVEAIKFMLGARQREKWSQRTEVLNTHVNITRINLGDVSEEDLHTINRIQMKYLPPPTLGPIDNEN